ncbi:hypothetical protein [Comamonas antarctica]|uniref:hypothetical protein n=1 Tax=Comamonas antarctica TaxID=2743470 RepID=UPI0028EC3A29|nr:hypothetical protein [Comamonas antarctica]
MTTKNTTLDDIAGVIGFTATLRLAAWYGNDDNLYVPDKVDEGQVLVRLLGRDAALRMAAAFPREWIAVPRLTVYDDELRKSRIGSMLTRGFSTRQVSKFERISERRVQQVCRELERHGMIPPVGPAKAVRAPKAPVENVAGKKHRL